MNRNLCSALAAAAALALAAPAAHAAPERLGRAPGGDSFAVIAGTPYAAYATRAGVRVVSFSGRWKKVGKVVVHRKGDAVRDAQVAGGPGGHPWLTWTENTRHKGFQVRVARLAGGRWREVVGGANPISTFEGDPYDSYTSASPQIAFLGKRPYVVFHESSTDTQVHAVRLSASGRRWQHVSRGLPLATTETPLVIASAGGRIYVEAYEYLYKAPDYFRFDSGERKWVDLPHVQQSDHARFGGMIGFGGKLHTFVTPRPDTSQPDEPPFVGALGSDDSWSHVGEALPSGVDPQSIATDGSALYVAYIAGHKLTVDVLNGSTWQALPDGVPAGAVVESARLAGAAGGGVWLFTREKAADGSGSFQLSLYGAED